MKDLSDQQKIILTAMLQLDGHTVTPQTLARQADWVVREQAGVTLPQGERHSWQGVIRTVASLVRWGYIKRRSYTKMTMYELTSDGREEARRIVSTG
jgi:hypothetical protein